MLQGFSRVNFTSFFPLINVIEEKDAQGNENFFSKDKPVCFIVHGF